MSERNRRRWLRDKIASTGLTQAQAAERLGVTRCTVENWIAGRHEPYPRHRALLAEVLGCSPDELAEALCHA